MRGNVRRVVMFRFLVIVGLVSAGAVVFSVTPASAANPCPPGYYSSTGTDESGCTAAPAGTFVSGLGAVQPTQCPLGTYQPDTASTSCLLAPAGTFVSSLGATQPTQCAPGYYQANTASTGCFAALPGTFVSGYGAAAATLCSVGSYQPNAGKTSCLLADIGYYVPTSGQVTETLCPPLTTTSAPGATGCVTTISALAVQVVGVGPGASLSDKVAQIQASLNAYDHAGACTDLTSFINEVNAQTGKTIISVQAATFVGEAQSMQTALGC